MSISTTATRDEAAIAWLLECGEPGVVNQVRRDLLDEIEVELTFLKQMQPESEAGGVYRLPLFFSC